MAVTWLELGAGESPAPIPPRSAGLRLVGEGRSDLPDDGTVAPVRGRISAEVRRRRVVLAVMGVLVFALALPLSGTGGHSHPTGSALAETGAPVVYAVQPGDSLWSIAERMDPSGDPRPLVARLAAQTGSETVVPGERIVLP